MITHLEPGILECEVKWALGRKHHYEKASGGVGIPVELFQILEDDAVKVLHSILLQHHSSKASILQCSAFFTVQPSHPYMTTGKKKKT